MVFVKKFTLTSVVFLMMAFAVSGMDASYESHSPARNVVTESTIRRKVEFLSDSICTGRATGTPGGSEAAFWLVRQFQSLGMLPFGGSYVKSFETGNGAIGRNVIGLLPGSRSVHRNSYIIVAAHFDGLGTIDGKMYPGADSNASGVAAMTELAAMFSAMMKLGKTYNRNFIFVGLDAKHIGSGGSAALWDVLGSGSLKDPVSGRKVTPRNVEMMINLEQIGSTDSPLRPDRKEYMIMLGGHKGTLSYVNMKEDIELDLAFDYYGSREFTDLFYRKVGDQKVFVENGKQAVMFTSGITMNNNKTGDRAETLDYTVMKKRIWLIFHWISRII